MLAAHRSPVAAKAAWGRMAEDLDDVTWGLLDEPAHPPSAKMKPSEADAGLPMLLKMTRLHDLGLAQLCVPDLVADEDFSGHSAEKEKLEKGCRHRRKGSGGRRTEHHYLQKEHTLTVYPSTQNM
jgi:hypothetical protein